MTHKQREKKICSETLPWNQVILISQLLMFIILLWTKRQHNLYPIMCC